MPLILAIAVLPLVPATHVSADGTTTLHIVKYANDGTTVLSEKTVDYQTLESSLPVRGDGVTRYYHQGPVFIGDMWDPGETENLKDKGPVKGTALSDLCNIVGGMTGGDTVAVKSIDGFSLVFQYADVYFPEPDQGTMVICWYWDTKYVPAFNEGMQLVFFSATTNAEGKYVFGNDDMQKYLPPENVHYFSGLPSSNGLSAKYINEIAVYSSQSASTYVPPVQTVELPPSAIFNMSDLRISSDTVYDDEPVTISVEVSNVGDADGSCEVTLTINNRFEQTGTVQLTAGNSTSIAFAVCRNKPDTYNVKVNDLTGSFTVLARPMIDSAGSFTRDTTIKSEDNLVTAFICEGTGAFSDNGTPLTSVEVARAYTLPHAPESYELISNAYDFTPDRAVFDGGLDLVFTYYDNFLPAGAGEDDIIVGWLESGSDQWQFSSECVIDTDNNTVTFTVNHFTVFALFTESAAVVEPEPATTEPEGEPETLPETAPQEEDDVVRAAGATSSIRITKYAVDGETVLDWKRVDYFWMKENLPVYGNGVTHYYHQGPVFEGDMWDPAETVNLKDKGAVMGSSVKDLCDLVGGLEPGNEVMLCAVDGYNIKLGYENICEPLDIQGDVVLCWYKGEDTENPGYGWGYPGNDAFNEALEIVFMTEVPNAAGQNVFGNTDMVQALTQEKYQHYYDGLPSTNGLCGKWISEIRIITGEDVPLVNEQDEMVLIDIEEDGFPWLPVIIGSVGILMIAEAVYIYRKKDNAKS